VKLRQICSRYIKTLCRPLAGIILLTFVNNLDKRCLRIEEDDPLMVPLVSKFPLLTILITEINQKKFNYYCPPGIITILNWFYSNLFQVALIHHFA